MKISVITTFYTIFFGGGSAKFQFGARIVLPFLLGQKRYHGKDVMSLVAQKTRVLKKVL